MVGLEGNQVIAEVILCDWCQKRIPPDSSEALQHSLINTNYGSHEPDCWIHFCTTACRDKWTHAHRAKWEDFRE